MGKHLKDVSNQNNMYGTIISRQGLRLVYLEDRVKELENQLIQERANRIEDLQSIRYIAEANVIKDKNNISEVIAEMATETLEQITRGIIQNKKEKNLHTNQDT